MTHMNYEDAKARFDELARKAETGETTVITQEDQPAFTIGPADLPKDRPRVKRPGIAKGQFWMAPDFNEEMPL